MLQVSLKWLLQVSKTYATVFGGAFHIHFCLNAVDSFGLAPTGAQYSLWSVPVLPLVKISQ